MSIQTILYKTVEKENLACVMKSGSLPVLATPALIAWMEEAACACLNLPEGRTSVGIHMDVSHDAPCKEGDRVQVIAKTESESGKILDFTVSAWCGEVCLSKGTHRRAVVSAGRFLEKLGIALGMETDKK